MWSFSVRPLILIWLMFDDLIIVKAHLMMASVDMALNFGIFVETQYSFFVLRCRGLSDLSLWHHAGISIQNRSVCN